MDLFEATIQLSTGAYSAICLFGQWRRASSLKPEVLDLLASLVISCMTHLSNGTMGTCPDTLLGCGETQIEIVDIKVL